MDGRRAPVVDGCGRVMMNLVHFARTGYRMRHSDQATAPHIVVVTGAPGSGKSFVGKRFAEWIRHTSNPDGSATLVSALELIAHANDEEVWEDIFIAKSTVNVHCIIIDDVYAVCDAPRAESGVESGSRELAFDIPNVVSVRAKLRTRIAQMQRARTFTFVVVLCSSKSLDLLPDALTSHHKILMGVPSQRVRSRMIELMIRDRAPFVSKANVADWASKLSVLTSGYLPADIRKMCDRALCLAEDSWSAIRVYEELRRAAVDTVPSELRDLDAKSSTTSFAESAQDVWRGIGGFAAIKKSWTNSCVGSGCILKRSSESVYPHLLVFF